MSINKSEQTIECFFMCFLTAYVEALKLAYSSVCGFVLTAASNYVTDNLREDRK